MATDLRRLNHSFCIKLYTMIIKENEFPLVVQAFQTSGDEDRFVAEQLVNTQMEVDNFTSRYAGLLIKAKKVAGSVADRERTFIDPGAMQASPARRRRASPIGLVLFILILLLIIAGVATGWIQRTFNLNF
jgi:hypothetical protein